MALDEEELSPAQEAILRMLRKGRVTAPFVAEKTGYSLQYSREQLTDLVKHGHVMKVHDGLYELVEDPAEE
jgi:predicted transcriptional regulator